MLGGIGQVQVGVAGVAGVDHLVFVFVGMWCVVVLRSDEGGECVCVY